MDRLSDLRLFVRLAETLSFTQTAVAVGVGRASVGRTVERIEATVGTRLIQRTTRKVVLTPDGEAFRGRCVALLADADEMMAMFEAGSGQPRGRLRVSLPTRMGRRLFAPRIGEFLAAYPGIELDLTQSDRPVDLIGEGIDCAIRVGPQTRSGLISRTIAKLPAVNVASPAYLAAHGTPMTLDDLRGHSAVGYVSPRTRRDHGWEWVDERRARTMPMRAALWVSDAELYIAAALAGLGLIQVPAYDVADLLASGKLVEVLPGYPAEPMSVAVVAPDRPSTVPSVSAFSDWAETLIGEVVGEYRRGA